MLRSSELQGNRAKDWGELRRPSRALTSTRFQGLYYICGGHNGKRNGWFPKTVPGIWPRASFPPGFSSATRRKATAEGFAPRLVVLLFINWFMALGLCSTKILVHKSTGTGREAMRRCGLDDVSSDNLFQKATLSYGCQSKKSGTGIICERLLMTLSQEKQESVGKDHMSRKFVSQVSSTLNENAQKVCFQSWAKDQ